MRLLPFTRPHMGLHITPARICLAKARGRFGKANLSEYQELPLPPGLVRLSPALVNLVNLEAITELLLSLRKAETAPCSVALTLPDVCARTAIFTFSSFPVREEECQALVAWRFQQELNLSTAQMRISYRAFRSDHKSTPSSGKDDRSVYVLATAIQHTVIEAYEALCLKVNWIPITIGLASFTVFDFCRSIMAAHLDHNGHSLINRDVSFFYYLAEWGFAFLAMYKGCPIFLRVKPLHSAIQQDLLLQEGSSSASSSEESSDPDASEAPPKTEDPTPPTSSGPAVHRLAEELIATLQYFWETQRFLDHDYQHSPLFLGGGPEPGSLLPSIGTLVEEAFPEEHEGPLSIASIPLFTNTPRGMGNGISEMRHRTGSALAAIAPLLVTS